MFVIVCGSLLLGAFLVGKFWGRILDFLNGPLRDFVERVFGRESCGWYWKFVAWLDDVSTASIRLAKEWFERFKNNVLSVKSSYVPATPGKRRSDYVNRRDVYVAYDDMNTRHVVVEETVPYCMLPDTVRHEMIRQRIESATLDERDVICRRFEENKKTIELATAG